LARPFRSSSDVGFDNCKVGIRFRHL